ncbi:sulfurtransferase [Bacillus sp. S/N-304-OC-R1]|uniref:sulfurtransferase n=1 Tax=Bacillus sp. S/N-304-OC-R1 TaxID=2758034 RepID=UPI001C8ED943|nr:sulfurtransferase [Bacillus sp. S/N-304-OC-R1]MBY0122659.1 sulfurtransferase [Bacillus sp. S/N-304-OC-R1]
MSFVVEKEWLKSRLDIENIRIADCRFNLGLSEEGSNLYAKDHIPGAVYFHLGKDLSGPVSAHGGRHPLPDIDVFKQTLQNAGISNETTVIAYDGGEGSYEARLWWLMKYAGHENVYVLNGGYKAWSEAGYPIDNSVPEYAKTEFEITLNNDIFASYDEVKKAVEDKSQETIIIDSRERKRYLGEVEPIDKKAGHIPGAINKVWLEGYENGSFKSNHEQSERFSDIAPNKQIIVYCGSGVTATPNFMALKAAGYPNVKLYAGSFSDWISYDDNEIETGE